MTEVVKTGVDVTEGGGCLLMVFGWGESCSTIYYLRRWSRSHFKNRLENREVHRQDINIVKIKRKTGRWPRKMEMDHSPTNM